MKININIYKKLKDIFKRMKCSKKIHKSNVQMKCDV